MLATLGLVALIGIAALAIDIGYFYSVRRLMQTAADASAIAAANAQLSSQTSNYQQAALDVAALNGFTNGKNGVTITVGPPATPPNPTSNTYVEVDIAQAAATNFLAVLGYKTMNVSVKAIAGTTNNLSCLYVLDPSGQGSVSFTGNVNVTAACSVIVDSSSSSALQANGSATLKASSIGLAGDYSVTGNVKLVPDPHVNIAAVSDPLASLAAPNVPTCTQAGVTNSGAYKVNQDSQVASVPAGVYAKGISISGNDSVTTLNAGTYGNNISIGNKIAKATFNPGQYQNGGSGDSVDVAANGTTTFNPGQYTFCGALSISGSAPITLSPGLYVGGISISNNANITFNPGTYILAGGGLSIGGNATLNGTGVTFYDTTGPGGYRPINFSGNVTANLSAPTSGPFAGILFFQDRSIAYSGSNGSTIVGNGNSTFDGALYFPTTSLSYVGNSSLKGYTFLIAYRVSMSGNVTASLGSDYSSLANGSPIKSIALYQ